MKQHLSRARVGFLIIIGVLTFVLALFLVGQKSQLFTSTFSVHVNFMAAEGVKPGSFVVLSGYNIGTVTNIELTQNADSVRLTLRLSDRVRPFVKADSKAEIKQEGLVGNKLINISTGSAHLPPIEEGAYIQGVAPFALTGLADNVAAVLDTTKNVGGELRLLLERLNQGRGTMGRLLNDPSLYENFVLVTERTEQGLQLTTGQLVRLSELLGQVTRAVEVLIRKADTTLSSSTAITREVEILLHNLNTGGGTIGAMFNDRALYDTLVTLISALSDVSYDASNAANQVAQSIYAMRGHWLFGRFMAGDGFESEAPPVPSHRKRLEELRSKTKELEQREARIREMEQKLGIAPQDEKNNR